MDILHRLTPESFGPSIARTVVLAQPPGTPRTVWGAIPVLLTRDHRVVLFDHDRGAPDRIDVHAADLLELADALRLQGAVHLGIGRAATIGAAVDRLGPGRFGQLVQLDPDPTPAASAERGLVRAHRTVVRTNGDPARDPATFQAIETALRVPVA
ncbi:MAG: hypothetical protein JJT89_08265 [Nitriliruptoraceae bacterium]|nr:hypothetical protein [Nitriliruptoraceae bacterium]